MNKEGFWSWVWHGVLWRIKLFLNPMRFKEWFADYENEGILGFCLAMFGWVPIYMLASITSWLLVLGIIPIILLGTLLFLHAEYRSQSDYYKSL